MYSKKSQPTQKPPPRKDPVFDLIQSMSRNEKRYFNINSQKVKNNEGKIPEYYVFYKILEQTEVYDRKEVEQKLLKKLKKEKFINYRVKRSELYDVLMKSLKNFHHKKSKKSADYIKILIRDTNFLFKRGLYKDAKKHLEKGRKLAETCGDTLSLIEINRLEREHMRTNREVDMEERLTILHEEEQQLLADLKVEAGLIKDYDLLANKRMAQSRLSDKESIEQLKIQFAHLHDIDSAHIPIIAQRFLWSSLTDYFQLLGNNDTLLKNRLLIYNWWKENDLWRKQSLHYYIIALSNLLGTYHRLKQFDRFLENLEKIRQIETSNLHESVVRFHRLMHYQQILYLNQGLIDEVCNLSTRVEKGIKRYPLNEGVQIGLIFNTVIAYFIKEDYKKCIRWIEFYQPFEKIDRGKLLVQFAQILKVIAFYELKKYRQMNDAYIFSLEYFKKYLKMDSLSFEIIVLTFINKLTKATSSEKNITLNELKKYLQFIQPNPKTYRQIGAEELLLWVESKLTRKTMISLLITNNKKRP